MAKRVRLSGDSGSTWNTLPGNTAELRNEAGEIVDTIFGQNFESTQIGMIGWTISANALYKGFAGYVATIMKGGTPVAFSSEAVAQVSGQIYRITNAAHRIIDVNAAIAIEDNGTPVDDADIESIDYLYGIITFDSGYTVTGPVTIESGNYIPVAQVAKANSFSLTQTAVAIDDSDFETAQANGGHRTFDAGLKTVALELGGIFATSNGWRAALVARSPLLIEINPDGSDKSLCRGWFKATNEAQSGNVGELEEETVNFGLYVPDIELLYTPFRWDHAVDTTLNAALRVALDAWEANTEIDAQYLHDGTNGVQGAVVVTEATLAGGLEVMNEFTLTLQGTGSLTAVP